MGAQGRVGARTTKELNFLQKPRNDTATASGMGKRSANGVRRARQLQMDVESPNGERFDDGTLSVAPWRVLAVQICYCRKTNTVLGEKDGNREGRREGSRGAEGGAAALKIQRWFHALGPDKRPVGRSVGVGVGVGRCEGGHALASIPYNQRRRFSKETRYRTRVRFTITYPTRSIPAIVAVEQSSAAGSAVSEHLFWRQVRMEPEFPPPSRERQRRTKERLARRRSCFFQRGLFGRSGFRYHGDDDSRLRDVR